MSKIVFKVAENKTWKRMMGLSGHDIALKPVNSKNAAELIKKLCIMEGYSPVEQHIGGYIVITVEKEGESQDAEILL